MHSLNLSQRNGVSIKYNIYGADIDSKTMALCLFIDFVSLHMKSCERGARTHGIPFRWLRNSEGENFCDGGNAIPRGRNPSHRCRVMFPSRPEGAGENRKILHRVAQHLNFVITFGYSKWVVVQLYYNFWL